MSRRTRLGDSTRHIHLSYSNTRILGFYWNTYRNPNRRTKKRVSLTNSTARDKWVYVSRVLDSSDGWHAIIERKYIINICIHTYYNMCVQLSISDGSVSLIKILFHVYLVFKTSIMVTYRWGKNSLFYTVNYVLNIKWNW